MERTTCLFLSKLTEMNNCHKIRVSVVILSTNRVSSIVSLPASRRENKCILYVVNYLP